MDSNGNKAGKGPLIQEEVSATLGTNQDQYLFQPVTFEPGVAAREGGHIYDGVCGTIRANPGDNQMSVAYAVENHPNDSRRRIDESGKCQALTSRMGTGGNNVPMVMFSKVRRAKDTEDFETWTESKVTNTLNTFDQGDVRATDVICYRGDGNGDGKTIGTITGDHENRVTDLTNILCMATQQGGAEIAENLCPTITASAGMSGNNQPVVCLEGNGSRPSHRGNGYRETDKMYTLNTTEVHSVCYGICSYDSNAMKSSNPYSGIYEAHTSRTLDLNGGNPACNQGGIVVIEPIGGGTAQTIVARGPGAVCYKRPLEHCATMTTSSHSNSKSNKEST